LRQTILYATVQAMMRQLFSDKDFLCGNGKSSFQTPSSRVKPRNMLDLVISQVTLPKNKMQNKIAGGNLPQ